MYHNLENLDLKEGDYGSYLKLTHRGKAVTLRGAHLHEMFQGIMEHTLQAVYEFDPSAYPDLSEGEPVVDWVIIGDINTEAEGKEQGPPATT
ncbi:hypothetical protein CFI11_02360 [Thalassococcus sp. S3]|nr:hypothetical protein CFI11_02360 [Thalassococcus sp. S3]